MSLSAASMNLCVHVCVCVCVCVFLCVYVCVCEREKSELSDGVWGGSAMGRLRLVGSLK